MQSEGRVFNVKSLLGKKILFAGISRGWSCTERMILKDCQIAKESGAKEILYCLKGTYLDICSKEHGITSVSESDRKQKNINSIGVSKRIYNFVKKNNIDIVHCYNVDLLLKISFFLILEPLVSLVFTNNIKLQRFYDVIFFHLLMKRVDHFISYSNELVNNISGHLKAFERKVTVIGTGAQGIPRKGLEKPFKNLFYLKDNAWYIGCDLSTLENYKNIDIIFNAFKVLILEDILDKNYLLILSSDRSWSNFLNLESLKRRIIEHGLEEYIALVENCEVQDLHKGLDLWIRFDKELVMDDYVNEALLCGVPCILPRSEASTEVIVVRGLYLGETYKFGNTRELRQKIQKVLVNSATYKRSLDNVRNLLIISYGINRYRHDLVNIYYRLAHGRQRLFNWRLRRKAAR